VDRLACVDLPAFPLQILLARRPEWAALPACVVDRESPNGVLLAASDLARGRGVQGGQTLAAALSLCPDLRAAAVLPREIGQGVDFLAGVLRGFSPEVEPAADAPGAFWLNAAGLGGLFGSPRAWAEAIAADLGSRGFRAAVAVGFTRAAVLALARATSGVLVLRSPNDETLAVRRVPLRWLAIDPALRADLSRLGKRTLGDLADLPAAGLLERFGPVAHALRLLAAGGSWSPLEPVTAIEELTAVLSLDEPEANEERLVFLAKRLLDPLLARLAGRREALRELELRLDIDRGDARTEIVRPAAPTLDAVQVLELVRLRLEALRLLAGVSKMTLVARGSAAEASQLQLFASRPRRDLDAAARALSRLRAELGDRAVVRAALKEGHLPEARFSFEPVDRALLPRPFGPAMRTLVRRILTRPVPLQPRPTCAPRGCLIGGMDREPSDGLVGPFVVSGGWWAREVVREYHFSKAASGSVQWLYFDRRRRLWFSHGAVE
jgi:protein ImuB